MQLVIGDKNLSSWSLRPWLVLTRAGAEFEEIVVRLDQPDTPERIAEHSPSGKVPVLKDGELTVWDSLAISVWAAERFPQANLWPADPAARALARSATCEMHAGFASLRGECPMNLALKVVQEVSPATQNDLRRLVTLWSGLRRRFAGEGEFLCGSWSIADAFYTPVATRIRSYGLRLSDYGDAGEAGEYCERLLVQPEFQEWEKGAMQEIREAR